MNPTKQWLDAYYNTLETVDSKEAVSILKQWLQNSIKRFEFDEIEYFLDNVDLDQLPTACIKLIIKTITPYSSEFEFYPEFLADAKKRI